jgi:hypothetical protein
MDARGVGSSVRLRSGLYQHAGARAQKSVGPGLDQSLPGVQGSTFGIFRCGRKALRTGWKCRKHRCFIVAPRNLLIEIARRGAAESFLTIRPPALDHHRERQHLSAMYCPERGHEYVRKRSIILRKFARIHRVLRWRSSSLEIIQRHFVNWLVIDRKDRPEQAVACPLVRLNKQGNKDGRRTDQEPEDTQSERAYMSEV